jgi:hypothetical protein
LLPPLVAAQSGTIAYDRADRLDIELPPELKNNPMFAEMPKARVTPVLLHFTPEATLQTRPKVERPAGGAQAMRGGGEMRVVELGAMRGAFAMGFGGAGGRRNQGEILASYTDLEAGTVVETRNFLGRTFRLSEPRPAIRWKLTTEQSLFLDHPVMRATAEHEGDQIEAWFTPDIPVAGGPEGYGGLPGMILTLTINDGERSYTATAVAPGDPEVEMKAPTDGSEVTREEYDKIVEEKLAELEKTRGGRRGGDAVTIIRRDG